MKAIPISKARTLVKAYERLADRDGYGDALRAAVWTDGATATWLGADGMHIEMVGRGCAWLTIHLASRTVYVLDRTLGQDMDTRDKRHSAIQRYARGFSVVTVRGDEWNTVG